MSGKKIITIAALIGIVILGLVMFWFARKTLDSREESGGIVQDSRSPLNDQETTTEDAPTSEEEDKTEATLGSLYTLDEGFRAEDASNPFIISVDDEKIVLAYEKNAEELRERPQSEKAQFVETTDGVTFKNISSSGREIRDLAVQVADGVWRRYIMEAGKGELISESSTDGVNFTQDAGVRFTVEASQNLKEMTKKFGVYTYFTDDEGGVVLLFNETTDDGIVVSRLYAAPETDGLIFEKTDENLFKGTLEVDHYADPYAITTADGDIRIVIMHQGKGARPPKGRTGEIYTFTSTDGGKTFTLDGLAFSWQDFTDVEVYSLNDPKIVQLSDGRFRIYAAAMVKDDSTGEDFRWMIVSAVGP